MADKVTKLIDEDSGDIIYPKIVKECIPDEVQLGFKYLHQLRIKITYALNRNLTINFNLYCGTKELFTLNTLKTFIVNNRSNVLSSEGLLYTGDATYKNFSFLIVISNIWYGQFYDFSLTNPSIVVSLEDTNTNIELISDTLINE